MSRRGCSRGWTIRSERSAGERGIWREGDVVGGTLCDYHEGGNTGCKI